MSEEELKIRDEDNLVKGALTKQFQNFFTTFENANKDLAQRLEQIVLNTTEKEEKFTFSKSGRLTTTATTIPKTPDLTFKNPLDKTIKVHEISFVPDTSFKAKGILEMRIDGAKVFETGAGADFADVTDVKIKFRTGKVLTRSKNVEIFAWTTDASSSKLLIIVQFGV